MSDVLRPLDLALIALYLVGIVWKGIHVRRKHRTAEDFFLAGRNVVWPLIGVSLFASNISSTTLVGLAGDAYATGISVFNYEWMAAIVLVFAGVFFLPQLLRSRVATLTEFLGRRYDAVSRRYFTGLTLFLNIVVDTAGSLYAGALMLRLITWRAPSSTSRRSSPLPADRNRRPPPPADRRRSCRPTPSRASPDR